MILHLDPVVASIMPGMTVQLNPQCLLCQNFWQQGLHHCIMAWGHKLAARQSLARH